MGADSLYALILALYGVAFVGWWLSVRDTAEAKRIYGGGAVKPKTPTSLSTRARVFWLGGLAGLVGAWLLGVEPQRTVVALLFLSGLGGGLLVFNRRFQPFHKPLFRYWLAGSGVWSIAVAGWALVFGRTSRLNEEEILFLAIVPPVIAALALVSWHWASRGSR